MRRAAPQVARRNAGPGYWRNETGGVLRPAVEAYLAGVQMTGEHVAAMRAYLKRWIDYPIWQGAHELAVFADLIDSREAIDRWLAAALEKGIDPL